MVTPPLQDSREACFAPACKWASVSMREGNQEGPPCSVDTAHQTSVFLLGLVQVVEGEVDIEAALQRDDGFKAAPARLGAVGWQRQRAGVLDVAGAGRGRRGPPNGLVGIGIATG